MVSTQAVVASSCDGCLESFLCWRRVVCSENGFVKNGTWPQVTLKAIAAQHSRRVPTLRTKAVEVDDGSRPRGCQMVRSVSGMAAGCWRGRSWRREEGCRQNQGRFSKHGRDDGDSAGRLRLLSGDDGLKRSWGGVFRRTGSPGGCGRQGKGQRVRPVTSSVRPTVGVWECRRYARERQCPSGARNAQAQDERENGRTRARVSGLVGQSWRSDSVLRIGDLSTSRLGSDAHSPILIRKSAPTSNRSVRARHHT